MEFGEDGCALILVSGGKSEGNQSSILELSFSETAQHISTSGSRKRFVASMDLRIALNLEPPNGVLLKRYGRLLDVLQAGRGECGGNQRVNCVKICVERYCEICCELVVNAVQKKMSSARFTSTLIDKSNIFGGCLA